MFSHNKPLVRSLSLNDLHAPTPKQFPAAGKELVLFIDINYTIILTDQAKGLNKEVAILKLLAERYSAVWDKAITDKVMTFRDFVKYKLCPDNERDQVVEYRNFLTFLQNHQHLDLLKKVSDEYNALKNILDQQAGDVFPSFIKLVKNLETNKHKAPYTIILRSFGNDLEKVVTELEQRTGLKFSSRGEFDKNGFLILGNSTKKTLDEIRQAIKPGTHGAWHDNYSRWKAKKFMDDGKLYPLDPNKVYVFWDDNACEKDKRILTIRLPDGKEIVDPDEFRDKLVEMGYVVPVKPRCAIQDIDYFIKLKNYAYYWSNAVDYLEAARTQASSCHGSYQYGSGNRGFA